MLSTVKRILIFLVVATLAILFGVFIYTQGRTYFNDEDEIGNTAGNIYNGGLFCEQDGRVFFSNDNADGSLYVMKSDCTGFKKVHSDKAVYINVDDNYVYYVRANSTKENIKNGFMHFNNSGVYRIRQNGMDLKAFTGNPGAYLILKGNYIYFQRYDVEIGLYLHRYQIDGKKERLLVKDAVIPAAVIDNTIYYTGFSDDRDIKAMDLSSFTEHSIFSGVYAYPIFMGEYIYYIDIADGYKIYRMKQNGSDPTLLVDEQCSTYNITNSGKYLYYQVDNTKNNRICRINLETMKSETLLEGNYKQINVTENYVFFKDFDDTKTYIVTADGIADVNIFNPPNLDAD